MAEQPRPSLYKRFKAWCNATYRRHYTSLLMAVLLFTFIFIFLSRQMFVTIPAGHGGVMWWRFFEGTATTWHFNEGTKLIPPWDEVTPYDLRLQSVPFDVLALVSDGLFVTVEVTVQFRVEPSTIGSLHQDVGPDYLNSLIIPQISSQIRNSLASVSAETLYSQGRDMLQEAIEKAAGESIGLVDDGDGNHSSFIQLEQVLIRRVELPDDVRIAIARKNVALHNAEQYDYLIEQERKETVRKIIEAIGIKAFQDIVSSGITDSYLRWKGIDATLSLAESNNAKMVIIGGGEDGLPIILGDWASDMQTTTTPDVAVPDDASPNDASPSDGANVPDDPIGGLMGSNDLQNIDRSVGQQFISNLLESVNKLTSSTTEEVGTIADVVGNELSDGGDGTSNTGR
jgi:regulator of protease activity HflC (stomatin/prohibitin superfamily)